MTDIVKYQPRGAGGTRSPPAMPYLNGRQGATKRQTGSGKAFNHRLLGALIYFYSKEFFDSSTPSMRNIEPPAKSKMAAGGPQKGRRGLERGQTVDDWT